MWEFFLNISPDHIGPIEHPSFEDYFYHKRLLMENSRAVIINSDMDHFSVLKEQVEDQDHDFYGSQSDNQIENSKAFSFSATGKLAGDYDIQLIGHFNQENAVAAGLACLRLGASLEDIKKGSLQPVFLVVWKSSLRKTEPRFSSTTPTMVTVSKNSSML